MAVLPLEAFLSEPRPKAVAESISDRLSEELVIALVGPVGSGVSTSAEFISEILNREFGYNVFPIIKPSNFIKAEAHRVGGAPSESRFLDRYITDMQNIGNSLRENFGEYYLAEKVVEQIYTLRRESGGHDGIKTLGGRRAYIIDSLKHPQELELLRQIYGDSVCVFGIFAPDEERIKRLEDQRIQADIAKRIMDRDQGEIATFGQNTRKLFIQSDFYFCNDGKLDDLRIGMKRFIEVIFNAKIHTPTRHESAMYEASSAAANSACMSRQVGAAIVSKGGELISVGWNDVPKFGGSLYSEDDQFSIDAEKGVRDNDHRCFKWGGNICHNEARRTNLIQDIANKIVSAKILKNGKNVDDILKLLEGTAIDSIIEYSRSIHAEMEAILSVAREGRHSLIGSTLYTNTYPCHNCARHIVASGIKHVFYIEPYLKSLAIKLHHDSITENPNDKSRVIFRQYSGVAPRHYLRLFRPTAERKRNGKLNLVSPKSALPAFREPLDARADYEAKVIADLAEKEQNGL